MSGSPIIQDGERGDCRQWRKKGAERVAVVDKIEGMRKPEDFIGYHNRKKPITAEQFITPAGVMEW